MLPNSSRMMTALVLLCCLVSVRGYFFEVSGDGSVKPFIESKPGNRDRHNQDLRLTGETVSKYGLKGVQAWPNSRGPVVAGIVDSEGNTDGSTDPSSTSESVDGQGGLTYKFANKIYPAPQAHTKKRSRGAMGVIGERR